MISLATTKNLFWTFIFPLKWSIWSAVSLDKYKKIFRTIMVRDLHHRALIQPRRTSKFFCSISYRFVIILPRSGDVWRSKITARIPLTNLELVFFCQLWTVNAIFYSPLDEKIFERWDVESFVILWILIYSKIILF